MDSGAGGTLIPLSSLNAQHWQPYRELKELFDDTIDHIPERRSAFLQMRR